METKGYNLEQLKSFYTVMYRMRRFEEEVLSFIKRA